MNNRQIKAFINTLNQLIPSYLQQYRFYIEDDQLIAIFDDWLYITYTPKNDQPWLIKCTKNVWINCKTKEFFNSRELVDFINDECCDKDGFYTEGALYDAFRDKSRDNEPVIT